MEYTTRWIELEAPTKKQTIKMTHSKKFNKDNVIVELHNHKTCYTKVETDTMNKIDANNFFKELVELGWKIIKNELA